MLLWKENENMMSKPKFLIVTTVPQSLRFFRGQIQVLKNEFDIELVSTPNKLLKDISKEQKVKVHGVSMHREISVFNDMLSLFKLIRLFFKEKPKVVHGNTPKAGLLSMLAAWASNVSVRIYYIHGLRYHGASGFKRKLLVKMEQLSCYFATDVFAVSNGVKTILFEDGITKKNVKLIWNGSVNGINGGYFSREKHNISSLKEEYGFKQSDIIFGFVGRLVRDKGIHELVYSFLKVNASYPESKLLLVGTFEDGDPIDVLIKEEIIHNKNIISVGFQKDVRPFYAIMNIFVFPSYREGFGISLMEAAAMGVSAISTDITGCNEIIKHNYNGLLIPPKSEKDLTEKMTEVVKNTFALKAMSKLARPYVLEKYDQQVLWDKTLVSYMKIFQNHL